ncbi:MAG: signal recognition particle-docking protein FtsY [Actinomycetes bacterium]
MSPILILIIVFSLVVVVAGAVMLGRPSKGELLEGPPEGTLPREAGSQPEDPNSLAGPEIEIVEPVAGILGTGIAITGPELTPEEEAANIAAAEQAEQEGEDARLARAAAEAAEDERPNFRERLTKARSTFSGFLGSVLSRSEIDAESWNELEEALIRADVGIGPAQSLLGAVRLTVKERDLSTSAELVAAVKEEMKAELAGPVTLARAETAPTIWLFVGVNGVGKTTTIGKLGKRLTDQGDRVVMAAGDTFRAAAAEQLGTWADRCGADLVRGEEGGDPSAVIFDAVSSAAAKGADIVLADTAGRLHNKANLMEELAKVRRVADKGDGTVTEVLLVLDATTGQNGLQQARQFTEATEVTGVVLTKLDGSAKGGIVFAIRSELGIPVKLVGLGETAVDLVDFNSDEFVDALFA